MERKKVYTGSVKNTPKLGTFLTLICGVEYYIDRDENALKTLEIKGVFDP